MVSTLFMLWLLPLYSPYESPSGSEPERSTGAMDQNRMYGKSKHREKNAKTRSNGPGKPGKILE